MRRLGLLGRGCWRRGRGRYRVGCVMEQQRCCSGFGMYSTWRYRYGAALGQRFRQRVVGRIYQVRVARKITRRYRMKRSFFCIQTGRLPDTGSGGLTIVPTDRNAICPSFSKKTMPLVNPNAERQTKPIRPDMQNFLSFPEPLINASEEDRRGG